MNFGDAIEFMKKGATIGRQSWVGFIFIDRGNYDKSDGEIPFINGIKGVLFHNRGGPGVSTRLPTIGCQMFGISSNAWVPSSEDILAEDWELVNHKTWEYWDTPIEIIPFD